MANIRKISDNSYKITVSCGRDANNKQLRHYLTWKPNKPMTEKQMEKAVRKAAFEFEKQIEQGFQPDCALTFTEFANYVIDLKKRSGAAGRTVALYEFFLERINADFGSMKLVDIRPRHLNEFYIKLAEPGSRSTLGKCYPTTDIIALIEQHTTANKFFRANGMNNRYIPEIRRGEPIAEPTARKLSAALDVPFESIFRIEKRPAKMSPATINRYHGFISLVFGQAEREMIILYNPATRATIPKEEQKAKETLQMDDIKNILEALETETTRTRAIIYTLLYTGMRRGELLALKWQKIDFEKKQLIVDANITYDKYNHTQEGKTKTGNVRVIPMSDDLIDVLKKYRNEYNIERFRLCGYWQDNDYVFCATNGAALMPLRINNLLKEFCQKHDLPHINPHMFRHTAASLMIANGVDVVTVSKILGHRKTSTTLDVYSHEIESVKAAAANTMNEVIRACKTG